MDSVQKYKGFIEGGRLHNQKSLEIYYLITHFVQKGIWKQFIWKTEKQSGIWINQAYEFSDNV